MQDRYHKNYHDQILFFHIQCKPAIVLLKRWQGWFKVVHINQTLMLISSDSNYNEEADHKQECINVKFSCKTNLVDFNPHIYLFYVTKLKIFVYMYVFSPAY